MSGHFLNKKFVMKRFNANFLLVSFFMLSFYCVQAPGEFVTESNGVTTFTEVFKYDFKTKYLSGYLKTTC